jgi:activating signal cointegrator 1
MKAITLTQPWASLVAIGAKHIDTRSWRTSYRGPLAIHAAKTFPTWAQERCDQEPFFSALRRMETIDASRPLAPQLPCGCVLAVAFLEACLRIEEREFPAEPERSFGDYRSGRYAWILRSIMRLPTPLAARGALSLWEWDISIAL